MFSWDYLDGICDWTQLRPLYKLLRLWQMGGTINSSCSLPGQALDASFLAYLTYDLPIWNGLPLSSVSLCPLCVWGPATYFIARTPKFANQQPSIHLFLRWLWKSNWGKSSRNFKISRKKKSTSKLLERERKQ